MYYIIAYEINREESFRSVPWKEKNVLIKESVLFLLFEAHTKVLGWDFVISETKVVHTKMCVKCIQLIWWRVV